MCTNKSQSIFIGQDFFINVTFATTVLKLRHHFVYRQPTV